MRTQGVEVTGTPASRRRRARAMSARTVAAAKAAGDTRDPGDPGDPGSERSGWRVAACITGLAALFVMPATNVGPVALRAQVPASARASTDTVTLTLQRALDIAGGHNPDYQKAENNLDLNPVGMRATWMDELLPTPRLQLLNTSYNGNLQHYGVDPLGNPISASGSMWSYYSNTTQSLNLGWTLQGASLVHDYRSQKYVNESRDVAATQALTTMQVAVRRQYMTAMQQRDLLKAEEELVAARRSDKQMADKLFSLALNKRVDVLNADLAVQQQMLLVQQRRTAYEKALLTLRTLLGDETLGPIRLADEALPVFDPSQLDADSLVWVALDVNPDLRQARVGVDRSKEALALTHSLWWPSLYLSWTIARRAQGTQMKSLFDLTYNEPRDSYFSAQISFPMFNNYFQNRQQQAQASVDLQNSREDARKQRLTMEENVRGALLDLKNQYQSLQTNERAEQIAQEALRLARDQYGTGTGTYIDLQNAINNEANARRQVITSRYTFIDDLLTLEQEVGTAVGPRGPQRAGGGG
jgi:outer membrane protein